MNHQWPPEVTRAMHQFSDAAPVAPSLTSVFEHRPIPSSSRPPAARVDPEERLVPIKEIYVTLDSPTSETRNRRRLAIAAAAVVVVVGVAGIALASSGADDDQSPSVTAVPTAAPTTTVAPRQETGDFEGSSVGGVGVTYTVPDGWETRLGHGVFKGDPEFESRPLALSTLGVSFISADDTFFTNFCRSGPLRRVGPTIDDLVSAFANLPGVDATAASDVTIDGYAGKQIEFTVPDNHAEDCNGMFYRCSFRDAERPIRCHNLLADTANQHLTISFLEVDGARHMIISGSFADTSQQDQAALDDIVASTQIVETPTEIVSFGVESANNLPVRFTKPDDWTVAPGFGAYNDSAGVVFDDISNIYTDGCQAVLLDPPVGPTVDDLVAAWANLPDFAATAAVDVTVSGYAGKQIEFTVPDYTASECKENKYALWDVPGLSIEDAPGYWAQGVGHHIQMWVLDVNGTRLVIAAGTFPDTSQQDRAALDEVLASIQIGCEVGGPPNLACDPADAGS